MMHVADFGALGDRPDDEGPALQQAIDASIAEREPLHFGPHAYKTAQELVVPEPHVLVGAPDIGGQNGTRIKAIAPMRSVMVLGGRIRATDIRFDANHAADHALHLQGFARGHMEHCTVTSARSDGVLAARRTDGDDHAPNGSALWRSCWIERNGTVYCDTSLESDYLNVLDGQREVVQGLTGTTDGGETIEVSGVDLSTLGLRVADLVRIGAGSLRLGVVESVEGQTITLQDPIWVPLTDAPMAIARGDGYREEHSAAANRNRFDHCRFRGNAGAGVGMAGLYGDHLTDCQFDAHKWHSVRIGEGHNEACIAPSLIAPYFEGGAHGAPILVRAAQQLSVIAPMDRAYPDGGLIAGEGPRAYGVILSGTERSLAPLGPSIRYASHMSDVLHVENGSLASILRDAAGRVEQS